MSEKTMGQLAFEAYCEAVGGQTFDGKPIPGWEELHGDRLKVQGGWEAAAQAVLRRQEAGTGAVRDVAARKSRWEPTPAPQEPEPLEDPEIAPGPQATAERAAQAKASVPVQAADVREIIG